MKCGFLLLAGGILAFVAVRVTSASERIDELQYWQQLKRQRADLMTHSDSCYDALVLKPRYRSDLLSGHKTANEWQKKQYSVSEQQQDVQWVRSHQQAMKTMKGNGWKSAGYNVNDFVGYTVGNPTFFQQGLVFKVFFEFENPEKLTPELYRSFNDKLASLGFVGDSKIPLWPGQARFQYNNLIVHGVSAVDGRKAELAGEQVLGSLIVNRARGLDVKRPDLANGQALDWHHFLCTNRYDLLPQDAKDWVSGSD